MHRLSPVLLLSACLGPQGGVEAGLDSATADSGHTPRPPPVLSTHRIHASELGLDTSPEAGFTGPGIAVEDFDGDGDVDVAWVSPKGWGRLMWNDGTGQLTEGIELPGGSGTSAADVDGDGDFDLTIVGLYGDYLARNDGTGAFSIDRIDPEAFPVAGAGGSWADVDGDGDLDLLIATYVRAVVLPWIEEGRLKGEYSRLFRNDGGTLVEWRDTLPRAAEEGMSFHASFFDPSGGVEPYLYLVNDFGSMVQPHMLLRWTGTGYVDETALCDCGPPIFGMGVGIGDPDNDGDPDLFLTNLSRSRFLLNTGDGRFADAGQAQGLQVEGPACDTSWGAAFVDLDLDGWEDLAVACGQLLPEGHEHREHFLGLEVDQGRPVDPAEQPDMLFANLQGRGWASVGTEVGFDHPGVTKTIAVGDLDGDHRPDLVTAGTDFLAVHLNPQGDPGVVVRLQDDANNVHGVGARIRATNGPDTFTRWLQPTQQGSGQSSVHAVFLPAGLTDIEVTWPDGETTRHGPLANGAVTLTR